VAAARERAGWAAFGAMGLVPIVPGGYASSFTMTTARRPYFDGVKVRVDATVRLGKGRKRMDQDGFWGCMKAALDGLTDAGVWQDDKQAVLGAVTYAEGRIPGEGEVELRLAEA
jgi:hypothetical protein